MLELQDICYQVTEDSQDIDILRDVSLKIDDEFTVITGPNGGGKSTMAKIITGIVKPTSGRILLDGEDITELSITERARKGISFAFQQPVRFKGLTVVDLLNLAHGEKLSLDAACHDEPEAGIDLWSFNNLIRVFEEMRRKIEGSIVIISHQERILNIADRIVVIADGRVTEQGTRDEVLPKLLTSSEACSTLMDKVV